MLFSSSVFLIVFLPVVLGLYYIPIFKNTKYKNIILVIFSILFYGWGEPLFVFLLLFSCILNYYLTLYFSKLPCDTDRMINKKKLYFIFLISYDIGILFIFKYLTFLLSEMYKFYDKISPIYIALPIGISFYTFQIISYVVDVYKGIVPAQNSLLDLILYIMMFPQLIAGPIVRYNTIQDEIINRTESFEKFGQGCIRFIFGLSKKVLLSNYCAVIADNAFYLSKQSSLSILGAWGGSIAYALQLYLDFSGYSDMAIGLGLMFGFHFPENFNYPFISKSITELWHRWHISLSTWFKEYVYIPLGGNRCKISRQLFNLFFVWLLTGIWHGANWTFLLWGILTFIILVFEKYLIKRKQISRVYTLLLFCILFTLFRSDSINDALHYWHSMIPIGNHVPLYSSATIQYFLQSWPTILLSILVCIPIKETLLKKFSDKTIVKLEAVVALPLFIICLAHCVGNGYNPFIYFNF